MPYSPIAASPSASAAKPVASVESSRSLTSVASICSSTRITSDTSVSEWIARTSSATARASVAEGWSEDTASVIREMPSTGCHTGTKANRGASARTLMCL